MYECYSIRWQNIQTKHTFIFLDIFQNMFFVVVFFSLSYFQHQCVWYFTWKVCLFIQCNDIYTFSNVPQVSKYFLAPLRMLSTHRPVAVFHMCVHLKLIRSESWQREENERWDALSLCGWGNLSGVFLWCGRHKDLNSTLISKVSEVYK